MDAASRAAAPRRRSKTQLARRDAYVARYYHVIEKVAKRLACRLPASTELADLISAGAMGLLEAAGRFDPTRGESFEAFARIRIKGAMLDDIRVRDSMSRDMRRAAKKIGRSTNQLTQSLGRPPTEDEVADHVGVSLDELQARRAQLAGARVVALEDAGADLLDRVPDHNAADPQEVVARRELLDRLAAHIAALPLRMQQVLSLYYRESLSLREIGAVLGVSECRVCQIHGEATRRLRRAYGEGLEGRDAAWGVTRPLWCDTGSSRSPFSRSATTRAGPGARPSSVSPPYP
jgi:RNA polymerase sigma factor for flagellar operon FliA